MSRIGDRIAAGLMLAWGALLLGTAVVVLVGGPRGL